MLPFVFASDDLALLELSGHTLRVWVDDAIVTRVAVTTTVTNGTFDDNILDWDDSDEGSAVSVWDAGRLALIGTGPDAAKRIQQVSVAAPDTGLRHALRIIVERGPVVLKVGSASDSDDYISEAVLGTGTHSLAFTPAGTFYISLSNRNKPASLVDSIEIEPAGIMELPTPWLTADLPNLRTDQSADVIFVACRGYQQRKIERRAADSWSVVLYESMTGPFMIENITPTTLIPSGLSGDITLTASTALFRPTNVGSLYRITSSGQTVAATLSDDDQFTDYIRVTGVEEQRAVAIILTGLQNATVTLQYSISEPGSWLDVRTFTGEDFSETLNDEMDNQLIYYRIGIKPGDYSPPDIIEAQLVYPAGSITGVARATAYVSETVMEAVVLTSFGATTESSEWWESFWSDRRGWPTAVSFFEGRLFWFGKGWVWGSIVDAYEDFDDFFEGDAGPIIRSIASGPIDVLHWAVDLDNLMFGSVGSEISAHSSTQDEPLTPSNFQLKEASTQGSSNVDIVKVDEQALYVQRSGQRVMQLALTPSQSVSYESTDITVAVPDLNVVGITQIAVQRQPDTRVHCVRSDGTVAMLVMDRAENVAAWVEIETAGDIEDVSVLPGVEEDAVYYVVNRRTGRYLERWAMQSECVGGVLNKQADSYVLYDGESTNLVTGLEHLNGETVVVWSEGSDIGTAQVAAGQALLPQAVTSAVIGLPYTASFKSTKLGAALQTPLNLRKRISSIGLVLADTHAQGLEFGPDFNHLDGMPLYERGRAVGADIVHIDYDEPVISFPGEWTTDSRICLQATAPRPATVVAASITMTVSD